MSSRDLSERSRRCSLDEIVAARRATRRTPMNRLVIACASMTKRRCCQIWTSSGRSEMVFRHHGSRRVLSPGRNPVYMRGGLRPSFPTSSVSVTPSTYRRTEYREFSSTSRRQMTSPKSSAGPNSSGTVMEADLDHLLSQFLFYATMVANLTIAKLQMLSRSSAFDHLKTALFVYVLLTQCARARRHLRARGVVSTIRDLWHWLTEVHSLVYTQTAV